MKRSALAFEPLEKRLALDAAPYVVSLAASGLLTATGIDIETLSSQTQTATPSASLSPSIMGPINDIPDEESVLEAEVSVSHANYGAGSELRVGFYYDDDRVPFEQPETAYIYPEIRSHASGAYLENISTGAVEILGDSSSEAQGQLTGRIQIHDADCPTVGTPVKGDWTFEYDTFVDTGFPPVEGTGSVELSMTVRHYRAENKDDPLVLVRTETRTNLQGAGVVSGTFDLTTGSEIEVVVGASSSATADGSAGAVFNLFYVNSVFARHTEEVAGFSHYQPAGGTADPTTLAIAYEVSEPPCYVDFALSGVDAGGGTTEVTRFRISPEIIANDQRFRLADPRTGEVIDPVSAVDVGTHLLLVDGAAFDLQSQFEEVAYEEILVHEPGYEAEGALFTGFYQQTQQDTFVIRSAGASEDTVYLGATPAEASLVAANLASAFTLADTTPGVLVLSGAGDDLVAAYPDFDFPITAYLREGQDVFVGGAASDEAHGGPDADALLGEGWEIDSSTLIDTLLDMLDLDFTLRAGLAPASGAGDLLLGGRGDDFLLGGDGDDILESGPGRAIMFGDSLRLTADVMIDIEDLAFGASVDFVRSGAGSDTIKAGDASVLIFGGGGADTIDGSTAGLNLLFGNGGDDTLRGRGGIDIIAGGEGHDVINGQGLLIGDSFTFETLNGLDFEAIASGRFQASLKLVGADSGDDTITGGNGFDLIIGGDGDDTLSGGGGLNVVFGDSFELRLAVGLDFSNIFAPSQLGSILFFPFSIFRFIDVDFSLTGSGMDTYHGGESVDVVFGGEGDDTLYGGAGFDILVGGEGNDTLDAGPGLTAELGGVAVGGPGDDSITGSDGADYLESEGGADKFFGLGGDDRILGGDGPDLLDGGDGNDWLYGEGEDDMLLGGPGDDRLFGGPGVNMLDGGTGNNLLYPSPLPPAISQVTGATYFVNYPPVVIAPLAVVEDEDSFDFAGGSLTARIESGRQAGDVLAIAHAGKGPGQIAVEGGAVLFEGQIIGTVSGGDAASPLVVDFNLNATLDAVQALVRNLTFAAQGTTASTVVREVLLLLNDGDGQQSEVVAQVSVHASDRLPGDYNGNGRVEQGDLDLVLLNWGQAFDTLPDRWSSQRPTSGIVDQVELDAVLLNWGARI